MVMVMSATSTCLKKRFPRVCVDGGVDGAWWTGCVDG